MSKVSPRLENGSADIEKGDSCRENKSAHGKVSPSSDVHPDRSQPYMSELRHTPPRMDECLTVMAWIVFTVAFPFTICIAIKVCYNYQRALIFRLGRLVDGGAKGPGVFLINPFIDKFVKVDMRTISFIIPQQEILSKDSVTVEVDAVVYYKIQDPVSSVVAIENADASTKLLAQTTLRNMLGTRTLSEMLQSREHLSHQLQDLLDDATTRWGMKVERVEIKDICLPKKLQRVMAAEAEASREARAKVIDAEGERQAAEALREAAIRIGDTPAALQLRFLQTLNTISAEHNSTIIFPFPMDFLSAFMSRGNVSAASPPVAVGCGSTKEQKNF